MAAKKTSKKKPGALWSLVRTLLWTACFLLLMMMLDQLALRLQPATPVLQELQGNYREFRNRLLNRQPSPLTIEAVIEQDRKVPARPRAKDTPPRVAPAPKPAATSSSGAPAAPAAAPESVRYLYVDKDGELQFADRLEDIPPDLRAGAQPLKD